MHPTYMDDLITLTAYWSDGWSSLYTTLTMPNVPFPMTWWHVPHLLFTQHASVMGRCRWEFTAVRSFSNSSAFFFSRNDGSFKDLAGSKWVKLWRDVVRRFGPMHLIEWVCDPSGWMAKRANGAVDVERCGILECEWLEVVDIGEAQVLSCRLIEGHELIIRKGGRSNAVCDVSYTGCGFSGGEGYGLCALSLPKRPMMMISVKRWKGKNKVVTIGIILSRNATITIRQLSTYNIAWLYLRMANMPLLRVIDMYQALGYPISLIQQLDLHFWFHHFIALYKSELPITMAPRSMMLVTPSEMFYTRIWAIK